MVKSREPAYKSRALQVNPYLFMAMDLVIVVAVYALALMFRYEGVAGETTYWTPHFLIFGAAAIAVHLLINWLTGVYRIINRYMSLIQAVQVAQAGVLATAILFIVAATWPLYAGGLEYLVPRSVVLNGGLLAIIIMIGVRFSRRLAHEVFHKGNGEGQRLLLVGAGQATDMLVREIQRTPALGVQVAGLVDDDPRLTHMSIQGIPVLGKIADVPALVENLGVTQIVVAIPSASAEELAYIYRVCKPAEVPVKILPSVADFVSGTVSLGDARDLDIKDLLGRPKIETDLGRISEYVQGQTVLVTGAGGSIGSELCRQLARFDPGRLVLLDHDESSLYALHENLQSEGFQRYVLYPTSILHEDKLDRLFALHRPKLVFHAAAYKHVPLMELNPDEAVRNNIKGTMLVAGTAARYEVERMVNISTDKAVDPINVMGATKRAGELIVRMIAERNPQTRFASVRFGNVLGSQGSVIPIFKNQIETGGPVIITHPDMTRYFMLIEEAVQLVIQAAVMLDDKREDPKRCLSTFVLEMGEPVSIVELAQRMIDFYWQDPNKSIGVEFGGMRPGEKLDERLVYDYEETVASSHPLIKRVYLKDGTSSGDGHGTDGREPGNGHGMSGLAPDNSHFVPGDGDGSSHDDGDGSGDGNSSPGEQFEQKVLDLIALASSHTVDKRTIIEGLMAVVPGYEPMDGSKVERPVESVLID